MRARRLEQIGSGPTAYWDVTGGKGQLNFAVDEEATIQRIRCALHLIRGEWFLDADLGVPWIRNPNSNAQVILGRFPQDLAYAEAMIKRTILSVEGVAALTSFSLTTNHSTRAATCQVTGRFTSGGTFTLAEAVL